jgi:hypothetical protein
VHPRGPDTRPPAKGPGSTIERVARLLSRPWILWFTVLNVAIALVSGVLQLTQVWHGRAILLLAVVAALLAVGIFGTLLVVRIVAFAQRLQAAVSVATAGLAPPKADLVATTARLRETQHLLGRLVERLPHRYVEDIQVDYFVGHSDALDRIVRTFSTTAQEGHTVLVRTWGELVVPSPTPPTYDGIDLRVRVERGTYRVLPIFDDESRIAGVIEFDPPISTTPLTWTISYGFPGEWRPLRTTGQDKLTYRVFPQGRVSSLRFRFTFPVGVAAAFDPEPAWGEVTHEVINGNPTIAWAIDGEELEELWSRHADPGQQWVHVLPIKASGFPPQA